MFGQRANFPSDASNLGTGRASSPGAIVSDDRYGNRKSWLY